MNRREFLSSAALAAGQGAPVSGERKFRHRGYLGWITDLASEPDPHAAWPSMRLDQGVLDDYRETFTLMRSLGFNEISIWGLYVSRAWPVEISRAVTPERGAMVERLIEAAHRNGIRVLSGLGVYSWGFDEIIRANPHLSRGNPRAMCASEPDSWKWMQRVVDFVFERFAIDGVSMQSADQGRCRCDRCRRYSDAEYHALLNVRTSEYIRSRRPGKIVGVNSWGLRFEEPETLPSLVRIGRAVDYVIDVHDTSRKRDPRYRKKIIEAIACDFGTLGGPQVEPPQHWARDRWFLPMLRRPGEHLMQLFADGGRACEFFFHILRNPGDELSLWLAGRVLSDPAAPWRSHLDECVERLYGIRKKSLRDALAELFLRSEDAYLRHLPPETCGTISLEPLVSDRAGPPVYLTKRLDPEQRKAYGAELARIASEFAKVAPEVPAKRRIAAILRCLANAQHDAAAA